MLLTKTSYHHLFQNIFCWCVLPSFRHCGHTHWNGRFLVAQTSAYLQSEHEKTLLHIKQFWRNNTSSFRMLEIVSMSSSILSKLFMLYEPLSRLYSRPSLSRRLNFPLSTYGSMNDFLSRTTTFITQLDFIHIREILYLIRIQFEPRNYWTWLLFL